MKPASVHRPAGAGRDRLVGLLMGLAVLLPVVWGQSTRPLNSFTQQLLAVACWCGVLMLLPRAPRAGSLAAQRRPALWAAVAALGLTILAALPALPHGFLPELLVMLLGLLLMVLAARQDRPQALFAPLAWGLGLGGLFSVGILLHQHLWPCQGDGTWIALNRAGRAYGNLRQPNLMGSYLIMALAAAAWLAHEGRLGRGRRGPLLGLAAGGLLMLGLALTASRTAALALLFFVAWGLLDRRLGRGLRGLLVVSPLAYALAFTLAASLPRAPLPAACKAPEPAASAAAALAGPGAGSAPTLTLRAEPASAPGGMGTAEDLGPEEADQAPAYAGAQRLRLDGDLSSGRGLIYRDALRLIADHPWTGVGWGHLPAAWMLSEGMVWRRGLLSHAHNLSLQLAVEAGLPLALAVTGLLAWAAWRGRGALRHSPAAAAAAVMLLTLAWHSQLEYPLWYAYFFLPACWLAGLLLGAHPAGPGPGPDPAAGLDRTVGTDTETGTGSGTGADAGMRPDPAPALPPGSPAAWSPPRVLLGTLALATAAWAGWEFATLRPIPRLADPQAKLAAARAAAQRPFYGHFAAYLVILHPNARPEPRHFRTALRQAYSVRMLWNYAQSLHRAGRTEEARYVILRLREFIGPSHKQVGPLFKACEAPDAAERLPPCRRDPPAGIHRWTQVLP